MRPPVIVTDTEQKAALAVLRSLAADGFPTVAVAGRRLAVGHWSRAAGRPVHLPVPQQDEDGFMAGIAQVIAHAGTAIVLPTTDAALEIISRRRGDLGSRAVHGLPPHDIVRRCLSKDALERAARAVELEVLPSVRCNTLAAVERAVANLGAPVVVKPVQSEAPGRDRETARVANDVATALTVAQRVLPVLVQPLLRGSVLGAVTGAYADSKLLAVSVQSTVRRFPIDYGGISAYARTVTSPDGLIPRVEALLEHLGWQGLFELEYLTGPDGHRFTIDFNPRAWGALSLAHAAGANAPGAWCRYLVGEKVTTLHGRAGQGYRSEDAELMRAVRMLGRGELRGALVGLVPRLGTAHAYGRLSDPLPLVARILELRHQTIGFLAKTIPATLVARCRAGLDQGSHSREALDRITKLADATDDRGPRRQG